MNGYGLKNSNSNNSDALSKRGHKTFSKECDAEIDLNASNKPKLQKMSSIEHVTPKVWSNQPHRTSEKHQWRPVRPKHLKDKESESTISTTSSNHAESEKAESLKTVTGAEKLKADTNIAKPEARSRKPREEDSKRLNHHPETDSKPSPAFAKPQYDKHTHNAEPNFRRKRNDNVTSLHIQSPRTPYKPSFARDRKSPGFGTLRRMWDTKANEAETTVTSYATSYKPKTVPGSKLPNTWHNTRKSYEKKKSDTFCEPHTTSIELMSPKPFHSGSIDVNKRYSFKSTSQNDPNLAIHSDHQEESSSNSESDLSDEEKSEIEAEKTLSENSDIEQSDVQIAAIRNDILNDMNDRFDKLNVGVHGGVDDDDSETEIDAVVYNSADSDNEIRSYDVTEVELNVKKDVHVSASQVVSPPSDMSNMRPDYLPMASQPKDLRYVDMTGKSSVAEVDYGERIVLPPSSTQPESKREYHEIDPNVPPPPRHEPPKLPLEKKPTSESSEPPPLPPANTKGRRSKMYSNKKKHEILKALHDGSTPKQNSKNKSTKKLKYVEVQLGPPSSKSPSRRKKTNYTEVVMLSEAERQARDRSGSGTSEEGLNTGNKKQSIIIPILPAFFKKEPKSTPPKESQENYTDFEKERNKKKRISGRFFGKMAKDGMKNKKENRSSHNSECEKDLSLNQDSSSTTTSETSINRLSGNPPSSTSATTSPNSSGDGEVGRLPAQDGTTASVDSKLKWKVIPTPPTTADNTEPYKPKPQPRTTSMNYKSTFSPTGRDSTFLAYPPNTSSTANDDQPKVVSSFLHSATKKTNSDVIRPANRSTQPPPVPKHRKTSSVLMETDLDASSNGQNHKRNSAPNVTAVPLPGLASGPSPRVLSAVPSLQGQGSDSLYHAAEDPHHVMVADVGIYNAAEDDAPVVPEIIAPPPLPVRDDDEILYETIVPPSPMVNEDHGYKFLEAEPLYQIYRTRTLTHASSKRRAAERPREKSKSEPIESRRFESGLLSEDLGTSTLWRSIPEVIESGLASNMQPEELKLQQSQFEVITSQASYLRSLNILIGHFMNDWSMQTTDVLPQNQRHKLFSNIEDVRKVEQNFLRDLEAHFWQDKKLTRVCEVIAQYSKSEFDVYIRYIQNQAYQDRTLTKLQRDQVRFAEELCRLESSPACNKLPLLSFLMLPMQRVTRLPLLVTAIVNTADSAGDMEMCKKAKHTLGVVNKLVKKCNESARSMQQTEQLAEIASQLDYSSSVKMYALVSQSRSLVKKGEMNVSITSDSKKATKTNKLWLFLFSDVLFIAKKKNLIDFGSTRFEVIEWAHRQYLAINEHAVTENAIYLVILENQAGKRVEMSLMPMAQNELSRWETALNPPKYSSLGESIYESWDCPQYTCIEPYQAKQPDELSLDVNDVMQVFKKTTDGWLEGERLRDGESGWFPAYNCEEIEDEHVRSRNMKNLYRTDAAAP